MTTTVTQHMPPDSNGASASLREVYALVEATRLQLLAQIEVVGTRLETKLQAHHTEHERENDKRNSQIRWAVTTVLSGVGVLVAVYLGVR